jgi:hypothetical protein
MTRRTEGPKRRAEKWADDAIYRRTSDESMRQLLAAAYLAGYRSAARARRIERPKPRK